MTHKKRLFNKTEGLTIVVKVGTSSLTHTSGLLNLNKMEQLVKQLADLINRGNRVVLVSSGAIGAGMGRLKIDKRTATMAQKQALAAVGQNILMHMYLKMAAEYGIDVGQVLLTKEDIDDPIRGQYSKDVLKTLLDLNVMPIVNENDAVAVEEIKFGDNDRLSAMVAKLTGADWLIMLSDIDGLFDDNPKINPNATLISHVKGLTDSHLNSAKAPTTNLGTGGMVTKLMAVEIADTAGIQTIIANSDTPNVLTRIFDGEVLGTWFESEEKV